MNGIKGIQGWIWNRKLAILADAAKYDASCASSGTEMRDSSDRLYQADWLMRFYGFEAGETGGAVQAEGRTIGIWVLSESSLRAKRSNPESFRGRIASLRSQ